MVRDNSYCEFVSTCEYIAQVVCILPWKETEIYCLLNVQIIVLNHALEFYFWLSMKYHQSVSCYQNLLDATIDKVAIVIWHMFTTSFVSHINESSCDMTNVRDELFHGGLIKLQQIWIHKEHTTNAARI